MLNSDHPDDERLAALAARETDAAADERLRAHVDGCSRCAEVVADLATLRAALAELPDVAPNRPLRLLPPVEATPAEASDSIGTWARRVFAPLLTAGAALAMVGVVGTAIPAFEGGAAAPGAAQGDAPLEMAAEATAATTADTFAAAEDESEARDAATEAMPATASDTPESGADSGGGVTAAASTPEDVRSGTDGDTVADDGAQLPAERSPWPMVLFAGVALMVGAALIRWIVAPTA